jgi:hypothetical protein
MGHPVGHASIIIGPIATHPSPRFVPIGTRVTPPPFEGPQITLDAFSPGPPLGTSGSARPPAANGTAGAAGYRAAGAVSLAAGGAAAAAGSIDALGAAAGAASRNVIGVAAGAGGGAAAGNGMGMAADAGGIGHVAGAGRGVGSGAGAIAEVDAGGAGPVPGVEATPLWTRAWRVWRERLRRTVCARPSAAVNTLMFLYNLAAMLATFALFPETRAGGGDGPRSGASVLCDVTLILAQLTYAASMGVCAVDGLSPLPISPRFWPQFLGYVAALGLDVAFVSWLLTTLARSSSEICTTDSGRSHVEGPALAVASALLNTTYTFLLAFTGCCRRCDQEDGPPEDLELDAATRAAIDASLAPPEQPNSDATLDDLLDSMITIDDPSIPAGLMKANRALPRALKPASRRAVNPRPAGSGPGPGPPPPPGADSQPSPTSVTALLRPDSRGGGGAESKLVEPWRVLVRPKPAATSDAPSITLAVAEHLPSAQLAGSGATAAAAATVAGPGARGQERSDGPETSLGGGPAAEELVDLAKRRPSSAALKIPACNARQDRPPPTVSAAAAERGGGAGRLSVSVEESADCAVCAQPLWMTQPTTAGPNCRRQAVKEVVNCGHRFHASCVVHWALNHKNSCPLCRQPVIFSRPRPAGAAIAAAFAQRWRTDPAATAAWAQTSSLAPAPAHPSPLAPAAAAAATSLATATAPAATFAATSLAAAAVAAVAGTSASRSGAASGNGDSVPTGAATESCEVAESAMYALAARDGRIDSYAGAPSFRAWSASMASNLRSCPAHSTVGTATSSSAAAASVVAAAIFDATMTNGSSLAACGPQIQPLSPARPCDNSVTIAIRNPFSE